MRYSPGAEFARRYPDWRIIQRPIVGARAMTLHSRKIIVVSDMGGRPQWDCSVDHEMDHLDNKDRCTLGHDLIDVKRERAVCIRVARRMIPIEALAAVDVCGRDRHDIAEELGVDVDTLTWRVIAMKDDPWETDYVNGRVAAREGAA